VKISELLLAASVGAILACATKPTPITAPQTGTWRVKRTAR